MFLPAAARVALGSAQFCPARKEQLDLYVRISSSQDSAPGAGSAAAISTYTYHPQSERSFGNVATVWATQLGWDAATYIVKEFWPDLRKKKDKQQ